MLGQLSFGTHPLRRLKGAMQISVIGHPLEVPFQALQGYFMTRVAGSFRFQTARGRFDTSQRKYINLCEFMNIVLFD